jgi:hypothetical protein
MDRRTDLEFITAALEERAGQNDPCKHIKLPFKIPRDKKAERRFMDLAHRLPPPAGGSLSFHRQRGFALLVTVLLTHRVPRSSPAGKSLRGVIP